MTSDQVKRGGWSAPEPVLPWLWQAMVDAGNVAGPRLGNRGELIVTAYLQDEESGVCGDLVGDFVVRAEPVTPRSSVQLEDATRRSFRPDDWDGDASELCGYEDDLIDDADLCDATFASKWEAFAAGITVGATSAQ